MEILKNQKLYCGARFAHRKKKDKSYLRILSGLGKRQMCRRSAAAMLPLNK